MDELKTFVKVSYKKSSSKDGGIGYDIDVCAADGATQEVIERLSTLAIKTAKRLREVI